MGARVCRSVGARTKAAALRLLEAREEDTPPSAPLDSPSGIVAKNGRSSGDARRLGERCKQTCVEPRGVVVPRRARVWRSVGARTKAAALRLLEAREEGTPPSAPLDSPSGIVAKNGRSSGDARRLGER